jgi:hypothetical protein
MMLWQLIWVLFKMPETKGVPLEQLEANLLTKSLLKENVRTEQPATSVR